MDILDFIYPRLCVVCCEYGAYLCETCSRKYLKPQYLQRCHVCKKETFLSLVHRDCSQDTYLDGVIIGYEYNDMVSMLIKSLKYDFNFRFAEELAKLCLNSLENYRIDYDLITAVPLAKQKLSWRGFNQSEKIARQVSAIQSKKYQELLLRTNHTTAQALKNRSERLVSQLNNFKLRPNMSESIRGRSVLLVDDVMTTGTTLEQSAKILKMSGVACVYGLVVARG